MPSASRPIGRRRRRTIHRAAGDGAMPCAWARPAFRDAARVMAALRRATAKRAGRLVERTCPCSCVAGEVGIEPTNAGIKIRCLTTWRLPKGNGVVRIYAKSRSGCTFNDLATQPAVPGGADRTARIADCSDSNAAKTQAPDPVMRAWPDE